MGLISDQESTSRWAEREHEKWISSFGDEPLPDPKDEDRIWGDDDDTPNINEEE